MWVTAQFISAVFLSRIVLNGPSAAGFIAVQGPSRVISDFINGPPVVILMPAHEPQPIAVLVSNYSNPMHMMRVTGII